MSSKGLCSQVSTHRAGRDLALARGFPMREQGPRTLLSSPGEPVGAAAWEAESDAELVLGGWGLTWQGERGGSCWSCLAADWSPSLSVRSTGSERGFSRLLR